MERIKPHILSGFMELLPRQQALMERIIGTVRRVYSLYGFTPLDTPLIESSDVLLAKGGGETEKQIYRFTKGDNDLSLRFDLTVPLARYVAMNYANLSFPFRRYQIGKVYRGERPQRGRFREFYQADIDIIGDGTLDIMNEAEVPSIIYRVFTELGLTRFVIRVNNRKLLTGFYDMLGLSDRAAGIMRTVDKLEKIGPEKVRALLTDELDVPAQAADRILAFMSIKGDNRHVLEALRAFVGKNQVFDRGFEELTAVTGYLTAFGVPEDHFSVDLTIARGLDYYTGTVYETTLPDHPEVGSVCSGGRYDDLAGYYTDRVLPGVGISIGLTRLFFILDDVGLLSDEAPTAPADVLILPLTEDPSAAISFATLLRASGIRAQLYSEDRKFKAKMNYANKLGVPFVAFLGEDEIASGQVSVKDMATGEQRRCPYGEAVSLLAAFAAGRESWTPIKE